VNAPTVSVVMSVYNGERFLQQAILSIHQQTWTDFEFILIDDASTDASPAIIHDWAKRDSRILPVTNDHNLGLTRSLNKGIRLARGRWIARMDADDFSLPERLDKQVGFLINNPQVGLLGSAAWIMNAEGIVEDTFHRNPTTHTEICWRVILANPFFHSSVMLDRQLALVNPYDESIPYGQDFELWGRFLEVTQGANLAEPLVQLGRHPNRVSILHTRDQFRLGLNIMKKRLASHLQNIQWNEEIIHEMRQITQSDWPTPHETSRAWERVLKLFTAFASQNRPDQKTIHQIRQQLIRHLLLSLSFPQGPRPTWPLLKQMIIGFPGATLEELFHYFQTRLASQRPV